MSGQRTLRGRRQEMAIMGLGGGVKGRGCLDQGRAQSLRFGGSLTKHQMTSQFEVAFRISNNPKIVKPSGNSFMSQENKLTNSSSTLLRIRSYTLFIHSRQEQLF